MLQEAVSSLEKADSPPDVKDALVNLMADVFASGWRDCCLKVMPGSTSHRATEPNIIDTNTAATATVGSDTKRDDCGDQPIWGSPQRGGTGRLWSNKVWHIILWLSRWSWLPLGRCVRSFALWPMLPWFAFTQQYLQPLANASAMKFLSASITCGQELASSMSDGGSLRICFKFCQWRYERASSGRPGLRS